MQSLRPPSATHFGINALALAMGLATFGALVRWRLGALDPMQIVLLSGAAIAVVISVGELLWRGLPAPSDSGLSRTAMQSVDVKRVCTRLLGLVGTLAAVAFCYWLFPEYHGNFYDPYWRFLRLLAPIALPLAVLYFFWTDSRLQQSKDAYWSLGRMMVGQWPAREAWAELRGHGLGWTVKAFFLPLMVVYSQDQVNDLSKVFTDISAHGINDYWYPLFFRIGYTMDLLFCVVGYVLTARLFDSQIRSTEPTLLGWLVALVCYQPFYSIIGTFYLRYDDNAAWDQYLAGYPLLSGVWGFAILALVIIYGLSTVAFGLRFSNLTWRGVITNGPYRFTKHPAYLSKNLSWWLISVPFLSTEGWSTAVRHSLLLLALNFIYFLRARTEERHLSRDPKYRAYAEWIARHGLLRRVGSVSRRLRDRTLRRSR